MELLKNISDPAKLRCLETSELIQLAGEIRNFLVETVSNTGGHLASSLGAVELTLALHYVFQTPEDKLIWDVGHQTYAHKILTGRLAQFPTLRQTGGLAGFPKREESPYDTFNTGHSSTSISAALGMARSRDLLQKKNAVVAIIGDGSFSNGMALEALNDAGHQKTNLLVILNDNGMSISAPVGGIARYLNNLITGTLYNNVKRQVESILSRLPAIGKTALRLTNYLEEFTKGLFVPGVFFEELGFRYFGPVDGHDIPQLLTMLTRVKQLEGPLLLHVMTKKGKGFAYAENNPVVFHGVGKFDVCTGEPCESAGVSFSQALAQSICEEARRDSNIVVVVAAMTSGTAMDDFAQEFPERFFDVGIAEEHAVTMAAGMACEGLRPVVAIYSTFLQRAYDQTLHDVCLQNLPVVFALDRAGVVGEDGPTHHGLFDIAYLRHIPNLTLVAPSDDKELSGLLASALRHPGPVAIRYPRGAACLTASAGAPPAIPFGQARVVRAGSDLTLLGLGNMLPTALAAAELIDQEGIHAAVLDPRSVKPLDQTLLKAWAEKTGWLVTLEDHVLSGGFGSAVLEWINQSRLEGITLTRFGFPDRFIEQGCKTDLMHRYELTPQAVCARILAAWPGRRSKSAGPSGTPADKRGA